MTIYFDTETTGLTPGRIIQLAYVLDYGDRVVGKNFYFAVDYVPKEASLVHGITTEKLKVLSGGKTFSCYSNEIYNDFASADLIVAHNVNFDIGFLNAEYSYLCEQFKFNACLDTMKYFTPVIKLERRSGGYKYPKLSEVAEFMEVYPYDASRFCKKAFNEQNVSFHDARFDVAIMYLCLKGRRECDEELKRII
ncbi:MAG: 3'-5' exonuclease [Clostridia bacterium]|nr:3'-5' exonuclease [Clostridia bacterium]